jgi:hypothetical protein
MPSEPITSFATTEEVKYAMSEVAVKAGLTGASEYLRIAAQFLVENQRLPSEFVGLRAIMKTGRKRKVQAAAQEVRA